MDGQMGQTDGLTDNQTEVNPVYPLSTFSGGYDNSALYVPFSYHYQYFF